MSAPSARKSLVVCAILLGLAIAGLLRWKAGEASPPPPAVSPEAPVDRRPMATPAIREALQRLGDSPDPAVARETLDRLRGELLSLPREEAVRSIESFLRNPSQDAATALPFTIGDNGNLETAPTLRIALLDWLGQRDPAAAAALARELLEEPHSADEWALCLRNVARGPADPETPYFLHRKWEEMVDIEAWRASPTVGFLEAFDTLVHARATAATPRLAELAADQSPQSAAVAHASFLTLDRLVLTEPAGTLERLLAADQLLARRGPMVAQLMARADLGDPRQRDLVAAYLLDEQRRPDELEAFAGVFPNANYMMSSNLLTRTRLPDRDQRLGSDRAALERVERWLDEERFAEIRPVLEAMRTRLRGFVEAPPTPER